MSGARGPKCVPAEGAAHCGRSASFIQSSVIGSLFASLRRALEQERKPTVVGSIDVAAAGSLPQPPFQGKPVVLVPFYSAVEKECDDALSRSVQNRAARAARVAVVD